MTSEGNINRIAAKLADGGTNVFFTGAGISTESGIPDYRSQGGLWDKFRPVYFDEFMSSKKARMAYWRQRSKLYRDLVKARPNSAHQAVFALHEMGLLTAVVTQNIDGLHQMSGLPEEKVIELHGNTRRIRCLSCARVYPEQEIHNRVKNGDAAPECRCGGFLKPDTISFGQSMPAKAVERSKALSMDSDVFIVVGSTLLVQPAAHMPVVAKQGGAFLSIVNLSETPCDGICDVLIRGKAGEVLPEVIEVTRQKHCSRENDLPNETSRTL